MLRDASERQAAPGSAVETNNHSGLSNCLSQSPGSGNADSNRPRQSVPDLYLPDSRLAQLDIGFWTHVPISNNVATRVLSLYFASEHPLLGFFDANLFLRDLVNKRTQFCSRFLVSSLLNWASHSYRALDPHLPIDQFREEAHHLWNTPHCIANVNTLAGAALLSVANASDARLEESQYFMAWVVDMSTSLGWYGRQQPISSDLDPRSADRLRAESHTAWGIFHYKCVVSFYLHGGSPLMARPRFPIPGDGGVIGFFENNPVYHHLTSADAQTFPAACQLAVVANEISLACHAASPAVGGAFVSVQRAEFIYGQFLNCCDQLLPISETLPHHYVILHMWAHCRVLDLFAPFQNPRTRLQAFGDRECTTRDVFVASLNQLKRHVLTFPQQFNAAAHFSWFSTPVIHTVSAVLADSLDPSCRFWFGVCMRAFAHLTLGFPIVSQFIYGNVASAEKYGVLSATEAAAILHSTDHLREAAPITGDVVADFRLAMRDRNATGLSRLIAESIGEGQRTGRGRPG